MSTQKFRIVKTLPTSTSKKKQIVDDDEETVSCKICSKTFVTEMALNNHAKMEHVDVYYRGDPTQWTEHLKQTNKTKIILDHIKKGESEKCIIKRKTEELIQQMEPTDVMTLASEDVGYIIIKTEDFGTYKKRRLMKKEPERAEKEIVKKEKEVQPITGPFECLQPSTVVSEGTCHQIFFSCCEYSTHFRDEHTKRRRGLRCQVCEKPLPNSGISSMPYTCNTCCEGFETGDELMDHVTTAHVRTKPYACNLCNKRFTQQSGLQQHTRMHTGDRPYNCPYCPKAFTQKSGLDQHTRIHTKVKPYRCVICGKAFCQSVHLKQHMRTHTNVSPFQCGICNKRFKQSSHLNYHIKYHNPAHMTEEQKKKYKELITMIGNKESIEIEVDINGQENEQAVQEISQEYESHSETQDESQDYEGETITEVISDQNPEYVFIEDGNDTWQIKVENNLC